MPRSALIVDDSRTALTVLSRLLKAQGVNVDTVESGPEALDHLRHNAPPGVIFLDHMMPGMDGFETLKALKADPQTAGVPVIMYTSREGENYIGQALVQGALGVLSKPVNTDRLTEILQQIDQLRGGAPSAAGARRAAPLTMNTGVIDLPAGLRAPSGTAAEKKPPAGKPVRSPPPAAAPRPSPSNWPGRVGRSVLVLLLLLPAAWFYQQLQRAERARSGLEQENARLQADLEQQRERVAAETRLLPSITPSVAVTQTPTDNHRVLYDTLAWALNLSGQYGLDEVPFDDARLAQLRELLARLTASGFRGTLRLESHVGEFCLLRNDLGEYSLPPENQPVQTCEVVTHPPAQAVQLGQRQSAAFARFLAERRNAAIPVNVLSHGSSRPRVPYPEASGLITAGDWNRAAHRNQRVEISLVAAPGEN